MSNETQYNLAFRMQLFTRQAVRTLYSNQRLQRWCFDVELLFLARRCGVPVGEVAVTWKEIPGKVLCSACLADQTVSCLGSFPMTLL